MPAYAFLVAQPPCKHVAYAVSAPSEKEARAAIEKYIEGFHGTIEKPLGLSTEQATKLKLVDGECHQFWPTEDL
jgi:hypothetical protein